MANLYHITNNNITYFEDIKSHNIKKSGFYWVDLFIEEDFDWVKFIESKFKVKIYDIHKSRAFLKNLTSLYDSTNDYDILIISSLCDTYNKSLEAMPNILIISKRVVLTIHTHAMQSFAGTRLKIQQGFNRSNTLNSTAFGLLIINSIIDEYISLRPILLMKTQSHEKNLLDVSLNRFDYEELQLFSNQLRRLEGLCLDIEHDVSMWENNLEDKLNPSLRTQFTNILSRIERSVRLFSMTDSRMESLIQIHFASLSNKTSRIMHILTVCTAIFLPLTLITGIFGMNFDRIPYITHHYGFHVSISSMTIIALMLFIIFKWKKFL